ncbi:MAG: hypothetical protein KF903_04825 [Dokdonella sp.]|uniref:hypothetical protein n=1 Tax=Dokdonella sp. TaxID=2291710 RepID=UPI0025C414B9|nr:hypothetical protein [Dokdonella sp.]MBX3700306.1 hypothetical protein [Dokdonella sp.]
MNVDHLRKQAKKLKTLYPELIKEFGATLTLSQALDVVARTHGFPSWHAIGNRTRSRPTPRAVGDAAEADIVPTAEIEKSYRWEAKAAASLVVKLDDNADPIEYAEGREYVLRCRGLAVGHAVRLENDTFEDRCDQLGRITGDFSDYSPSALRSLVSAAHQAVDRCPAFVDGWNFLAGALFRAGLWRDSLAISEPIATGLLSGLPTSRSGVVQVCYGMLANRPFFRIAHCYLLGLHHAERHVEADTLAHRLYSLWPNDNMGFRFLLSREGREQATG